MKKGNKLAGNLTYMYILYVRYVWGVCVCVLVLAI